MNYFKRTILLASLAFLFTLIGNAQNTTNPKVYIVPMDNNFDGFLSAAMLDKKVPVLITMDEASADYVLVGASAKSDHKWSDTVFGTDRDRNQGSIKLIEVKTKAVVFAASAGDKSTLFVGWKKTGPKKVADKLAGKLNDYFKKQK